jgi:sugar phosphate isomerase/epimerase
VEEMKIGTFARTTEQALKGLTHNPDFIDLRLDLNHQIEFSTVKTAMNKAGVPCTLHLPSNPQWNPVDISQDIVPYIDLGEMIEAELVTFHSPLSTLFYDDETIDTFLQAFPLAYDAAREAGITLAVETLGHYFTELMLLFDDFPNIRMVLDIGHGQILSIQNRAIGHIEAFSDYIEMVNVHDNNACERYKKDLQNKSLAEMSQKDLREVARQCDEHLPIGKGMIDFDPIFALLKEHSYDGRFLMMCADPDAFEDEREKFNQLWLAA